VCWGIVESTPCSNILPRFHHQMGIRTRSQRVRPLKSRGTQTGNPPKKSTRKHADKKSTRDADKKQAPRPVKKMRLLFEPKARPAPKAIKRSAELLYEVEAVLDARTGKFGPEYLVKWRGYSASKNQWIDELPSFFRRRCLLLLHRAAWGDSWASSSYDSSSEEEDDSDSSSSSCDCSSSSDDSDSEEECTCSAGTRRRR
jgi:hypothetical protein